MGEMFKALVPSFSADFLLPHWSTSGINPSVNGLAIGLSPPLFFYMQHYVWFYFHLR